MKAHKAREDRRFNLLKLATNESNDRPNNQSQTDFPVTQVAHTKPRCHTGYHHLITTNHRLQFIISTQPREITIIVSDIEL